MPSDGVSVRPVRTSYTPCILDLLIGKGLQSFGSSCFWAFHCLAMDSKELSSILDWFGDQKAIKTPKLNTFWLELIARVLNMLIGLKGDNYYSKMFKRVNHKLSNSTFWIVISFAKVAMQEWLGKVRFRVWGVLEQNNDVFDLQALSFFHSCLIQRRAHFFQ